MGICSSVLILEYPELFERFQRNTVYSISVSQFYNFFQESFLHPRSYVFYDARNKAAFLEESVKGAVWGWEHNTLPTEQSLLKSSEGRASPKQSTQRNTVSSVLLNRSSEAFKGFYHLLKKETEKRTVVVFADKKHSRHLASFIHHLLAAGADYRLLCVLKPCISSIRDPRYSGLLSSTHELFSGPVEIISPVNTRTVRCSSLLVSGGDIISQQISVIRRFHVSAVVNLGSTAVRSLKGVQISVFSSKLGTPDLISAAECIQMYINKKQSVLVIDDRQGREYAASCCAVYLVMQGLFINEAIQYIKTRKPSADVNYLSTVHSIGQSIQKKQKIGKTITKRPNKAVDIPMDCLDKWDNEYVAIIEEIIETVIESPSKLSRNLEYKGLPQENEESASSKKTIRFKMQQGKEDSFSETTDRKQDAVEGCETDQTKTNVLMKSGNTNVEQNHTDMSYPLHEDALSSATTHSASEEYKMSPTKKNINRKRSLARKKTLKKPGSTLPSSTIVHPNTLLDLNPLNEPSKLSTPSEAVLDVPDDQPDQYEYIELDIDSNIQCGVIYEAEDGTTYYYEEVYEENDEDYLNGLSNGMGEGGSLELYSFNSLEKYNE